MKRSKTDEVLEFGCVSGPENEQIRPDWCKVYSFRSYVWNLEV